jgi:3-dehydroquinate synthase
LFLYGPPASGKSSLGRLLARRLRATFYDLDALIEASAGQSIPDIFSAEGELGFRRRERDALETLLAGPSGIVALGGGALLDADNRAAVEAAGPVLRLSAPFDEILRRLNASAENGRPLLDGDTQARLRNLLDERQPHYASFPLQLETVSGGDAPALDETAWQAQTLLGRFRVDGMGEPYDVRILDDGLASLGAALQARRLHGPVALVSDEHVAALHLPAAIAALEAAGYAVHPLVLPAGEQHKTIAAVQRLWESFTAAQLERGSTVVALGGGVIGDLAGFAAATFLRGVPWVVVPSSLLAMVDASLGGKTGADLPQGKNLIGAFHPPAFVLADPRLLRTLPEAELRNGLAEVVKHGVLADPRLFELCALGWQAIIDAMDEIVRRAVAVKIRVIVADPYERGRRAALNLGHTLGHALEIASDFQLKHGEAVAIGMVQAARLAERRGLAQPGLAQEIETVLNDLGLPTVIPPGLERERILTAARLDKKRAGGQARLVLPQRIGEVQWGLSADLNELLDA